MNDYDCLNLRVNKISHQFPPEHHVPTTPTSWTKDFLSTWVPKSRLLTASTARNRYENPWKSWHKPTPQEIWNAFEWGDDTDPCIQLAAKHLSPQASSEQLSYTEQAAKLLTIQEPDFTFNPSTERSRVTWLGHAGVLVQLPPLEAGARPVRCLFDPIFSMRCSPNQSIGPMRTYEPPCRVSDLPPIDLVMISHDHYDHLDYTTISQLWERDNKFIRFLVPLGNAQWFASCGIADESIVELDWWDSAHLSLSDLDSLSITCTPSQHNSGRGGAPANSTLWSSWFLDFQTTVSYKVFFAGDTGFQFHDSLTWPPTPFTDREPEDLSEVKGIWPTCPVFEQIAQRLGSPQLSILPVAVGATYDYLRSFSPLPNSINPFPRHRPGVTGANHMPPWDAVKVFRLMTASEESNERPVALAMHWGTFVRNSVDILKTLGQLEWACEQQGVRFARSLESTARGATFLALNHGQSIST